MEMSFFITLATAVSGILLGWTGRAKSYKEEIAQEAGADASLTKDVSYIKRDVDQLQQLLRMQNQRLEEMAERTTRVDESVKHAHKRLDRLGD